MYRLGIIGSSSGNGHPYSWASIFNGYNADLMEKHCPFPLIPKYLKQQSWPDSRIKNAVVHGIWTQSNLESNLIAKCAEISSVYDSLDHLLDSYSYILLARDDAENHYLNCSRALQRGSFVYVDKPIALSVDDLTRLYDKSQSHRHIFSCSAMSYCPDILEFVNCFTDPELGVIEFYAPYSWERYAVHLVDPFITALSTQSDFEYQIHPLQFKSHGKQNILSTLLHTSVHTSPIKVEFKTSGAATCNIGFDAFTHCRRKLISSSHHSDSFHAFKSALLAFRDRFRRSTISDPFSYKHHSEVVSLLSYRN